MSDKKITTKEEIILTEQELKELTNTIKFREKVCLYLKRLNGVPDRVTKLEIHSKIHWAILFLFIAGVLGMAWKVLAMAKGEF